VAKKSRRAKKLVEAAPAPPKKAGGKGAWRLMDRTSALVAGMLAAPIAEAAWRVATGKKPPMSGRHPDVGAREAVGWAVVEGALIELVKVGVRRWTANYWVRSTGNLPPGMKPLSSLTPGNDKEPVQSEPTPERTTKKVSRRSRGK
jgi:hypothetical protein